MTRFSRQVSNQLISLASREAATLESITPYMAKKYVSNQLISLASRERRGYEQMGFSW